MKRIRRFLLTVRRREISISVTGTLRADDGSVQSPAQPASPLETQIRPPEHCPQCGAAWSANFAGVLEDFAVPLEQLQAALLDRRLHSFWLTEGQFLVCEQSLRTLAMRTLGEIDP